MRTKLAILLAGAGLVLTAVPVAAHHAFAAEFDAKKPIKLKGTVEVVGESRVLDQDWRMESQANVALVGT